MQIVKKKEQLFHIIKSLTKEEKRHFKIFVNKYNSGRENNYLKLFNAIDKQKIYDEGIIKTQFRDEAFIKQLTVTKNYLLKQIIKSLQNIHSDETDDLRVLSIHHQIAILYKKAHYEICRDLVRKGIEICSENDFYLPWIGFLKWELELVNKINVKEYKASLIKYLEKTSQLISFYEITTQSNHLLNQLQIFALDTPTFGSYNKSYKDLIEKILLTIKNVDVGSLPLKTLYDLYFPLAQSYLAILDYIRATEIYLCLYENLKSSYHSRGFHEQYLNVVIGLIYSSGGMNKPGLVKMGLEELSSIPDVNQHIRFKKEESLSFYPLITCALGGLFNEGLKAIENIEGFLAKYKDKNTSFHYIFAYYYAAYIHLGHEEMPLALKYLRKADTYHQKELLPNIRLAINLMEITVFYEQRKSELVESRLRSLQRQLKDEIDSVPFLRNFVMYYQQLVNLEPDSSQAIEIYKQFLGDLTSLGLQDQISIFIHFDIISWLECRIDGSHFSEKLQNNAARLFVEMPGN
jgi:hypothetical protein